jgi:SAM-dependent methyltransferase
MNGTSEKYFLAEAPHDAELARLHKREAIHGPRSQRLLTQLGVGEGWKCLEVGAGAGGVARWLAERVGSSGQVVATDINLRFLEDIHLPNLQVRRHDIVQDELEQGVYDLVHCRTVLAHLRQADVAIGRMVRALRPGGVLLAEEPLRAPTEEIDPSHPGAVEYTRIAAAVTKALTANGADLSLGLKLPRMLARLGLVEVGGSMEGTLVCGADKGPLAFGTAVNVMRSRLVGSGAISDADVDTYLAIEASSDFAGVVYSLAGVWGRRPSA